MGSTDGLRGPICPFPLSWPPLSSTPSWLAQLFLRSDHRKANQPKIFAEGITLRAKTLPCPCHPGTSPFFLLSGSPVTPKGLLAKVCSLDFVFFPHLLYPPSACWLWPQRQPLSVPANTSQLCVQTKPESQRGLGLQKGHFQGTLGVAAGRAEATV